MLRQVDADDRVAIGRHRVHLRPRERAARASLVDDDEILVELHLEQLLLQPRRDVGFAARRKWNDVLHRLVRIAECRGRDDGGGSADESHAER